MQVSSLESLVWDSVRCAKNSPESIYKCPTCSDSIVIHPNYMKHGIKACIKYDKCNNMEDIVKQMVSLRNATYIRLDREARRSFVEFQKSGSTHICRMTYETLRKGGLCKTCTIDNKRTAKPSREKLIRAECACQGVRKGSKPHVCPHHNFLICYPEYSNYWDYNKNTVSPYHIAPMSKVKCWFKCLKNFCSESSGYGLDDLVLKNLGCSYCSGHKVNGSNCILTTHPELCVELHSSNIVSPTTVSHGSHVNMRWTCKNNHLYEMSPAHRLMGHGCRQCSDPGYEQRVGGHEYFIKLARGVHGDKYFYPEEYKGTQTPIRIYCSKKDFNGSVHGDFMQEPASHKNGQGCPKCAAQQSESKGVTKLKSILNLLGYVHESTYFTEQTLIGLYHNKPLRVDICIPSENLIIEYDGEQHFKVTGWTPREKLESNKYRDLLKDTYCVTKGINILRIPYSFDLTLEFIKQVIDFCRTGKLLYASYAEYMNILSTTLDMSKVHYAEIKHR